MAVYQSGGLYDSARSGCCNVDTDCMDVLPFQHTDLPYSLDLPRGLVPVSQFSYTVVVQAECEMVSSLL